MSRLRHNVIKTALRTLSLAYSRISLGDIRAQLALESEEDAEYIVAKAIRDGVVQARIDHDKGEMTSREAGDVYSTGEPVREFDRRIGFLLDLYNQSVKVRSLPLSSLSLHMHRELTLGPPRSQSMRYPLNAHSKELASAGEARERERELVRPSPPLSLALLSSTRRTLSLTVCSHARRPRRSRRATRTPTWTGRATWTRSEEGARGGGARCRYTEGGM